MWGVGGGNHTGGCGYNNVVDDPYPALGCRAPRGVILTECHAGLWQLHLK